MNVNLKIGACACKSEELRPLIKKQLPYKDTASCDGFKVFLFLLLVIALIIGGYLLYEQNRITISSSFDLVHRDVWGADESLSRGEILNKSMVTNVIIFETKGPSCNTFIDCVNLLREMQVAANKSTGLDIAYNFLIGGDGQTYEARGWGFKPGFWDIPRNSSLAVAFIGDYSLVAPQHAQIRQAQALIVEAISTGHLQRDYKVYGFRALSESLDDEGAIFVELTKRWKRWVGMI